ncbi:MAG: SWIM zinc finger domain-containing protein [Chloroflexi bacterium]|nr:SWIM zinc finger domain-containing protein [Chloroflexota bacterium]
MNQLTEADVRSLASDRSFERGYTYYRTNSIGDVAQRGSQVTAAVEGSQYEPYQVQIVFNDEGIQSARCSCPFDWGGYCKHIVAVALLLVHKTEAVETKPEMASLLADLSEAQLRQLILNVAEGDTAVIETIEREIEWLKQSPLTAAAAPTAIPVDINAIRREMGKDFRRAAETGGGRYDYYDYDEGLEIYSSEIFGDHLEKMDALLDAGDVETAVAVITVVIEEWIEGITNLDEWVYEYNMDSLAEDAHLLGAALAEVLLSLELFPDDQEEWIKRIHYWEGDLGNMGIAETAVEQGWEYLPLAAVLQGNITAQGDGEGEPPYFADNLALVRLRILKRQERYQEYMYLAQAEGQFGLYVNMLAYTDQIDKAVAEARENLRGPASIHNLAQILVEKGNVAEALDIGEYGLDMAHDHGKVELAQWLRQQAEEAGNPPLALKAARTAFTNNHELADYQAAQRLAGSKWPAVKEELLQSLKAKGWGAKKINVYLYEEMLVEAMLVIDKEPYSADLTRVVQTTQEKHPDWGIQKYKNRAEAIMDAGQAKNYDTAVSWLRLARDIYLQHGRQAEWHDYLNGLLNKHSRKYKLVPMLRTIRNS